MSRRYAHEHDRIHLARLGSLPKAGIPMPGTPRFFPTWGHANGSVIMALKVPSSWGGRTPPEDLIEEALDWLRVQERSRAQAKENILGIIEQYKADEVTRKSSLSVGGGVM